MKNKTNDIRIQLDAFKNVYMLPYIGDESDVIAPAMPSAAVILFNPEHSVKIKMVLGDCESHDIMHDYNVPFYDYTIDIYDNNKHISRLILTEDLGFVTDYAIIKPAGDIVTLSKDEYKLCKDNIEKEYRKKIKNEKKKGK